MKARAATARAFFVSEAWQDWPVAPTTPCSVKLGQGERLVEMLGPPGEQALGEFEPHR